MQLKNPICADKYNFRHNNTLFMQLLMIIIQSLRFFNCYNMILI